VTAPRRRSQADLRDDSSSFLWRTIFSVVVKTRQRRLTGCTYVREMGHEAWRSELPDEALLPFPGPPLHLGAASAARSTLVTTSIQSLRRRGLYDSYVQRLDDAHREALVTTVAGVWLPIDAAVAHYASCDALGLDAGEQLEIAMEVGDRVHGTFLGMMLRMARTAGVTPWPALAQSAKLYGRLFCGGGVAVTPTGPNDARVDLVGNALCGIEYFRVGVRGVYQAALQLFCRRVTTFELALPRAPHAMAIRISWA
jgi:hypothetical protein